MRKWWWWQESGEDVLLEEEVCGAAVCGMPLSHMSQQNSEYSATFWLVATNLRLALMLPHAEEDVPSHHHKDQALQPDMWVPEHCAVALQGGWTHARGRWDSLCGVWNVIPLGMVLRVSMTDSASSPLAVFTRSTATPIPLTPTRGASPASPPVSYLRAPTARDIWDRRGSAGFPLPVVSLMLTYADEMT